MAQKIGQHVFNTLVIMQSGERERERKRERERERERVYNAINSCSYFTWKLSDVVSLSYHDFD